MQKRPIILSILLTVATSRSLSLTKRFVYISLLRVGSRKERESKRERTGWRERETERDIESERESEREGEIQSEREYERECPRATERENVEREEECKRARENA